MKQKSANSSDTAYDAVSRKSEMILRPKNLRKRTGPAYKLSHYENAKQPTKALLVASTGGHLAQLVRISKTINCTPDSLWVTFDTPQSRSLLKGARILFVPYIKPRDLLTTTKSFIRVTRLLRHESFDISISTGAAIALAGLPAARFAHIPASYIESVSRVDGPSLSGRIISALRLAETYTQHPNWASPKWKAFPSVLGQFQRIDHTKRHGENLKLFVTLGTIKPYRFDSLIESILETGLADEDTVWQLGESYREGLPGQSHKYLTAAEFQTHCQAADVVVTHAGVGTILQLLEWGIHPVVVPRSRDQGEHVDDHQHQIADHLRKLGVASVIKPKELKRLHLFLAANSSTIERL